MQILGWILGGMTPVSDGIKELAPEGFGNDGHDALSAQRRPGYSVPDCVAEPRDSVSPDRVGLAATE
jgi:hypothetical protein